MQATIKALIVVGIDVPAHWQMALRGAGIVIKTTPIPSTATCMLADYPTAAYLCSPDAYLLLDDECKNRPWIALVETPAGQSFALRLGAQAVLTAKASAETCMAVVQTILAAPPIPQTIPTMLSPYPALIVDQHQRIVWTTEHIPQLLQYNEKLYGRHINLILTDLPMAEREWRAHLITALGETIAVRVNRIPHPIQPELSIFSLINLQPYLTTIRQLDYLFGNSTQTLPILSPQNILVEIGKTICTLVSEVLNYFYLNVKHNTLHFLPVENMLPPLAIHFTQIMGRPLTSLRIPLQKPAHLLHNFNQKQPVHVLAHQLPEITYGYINTEQSAALQTVYQYQSLLIIPLTRPKGLLGFLTLLLKTESSLSEDIMQQLERLSAIATITLEVLQQSERIKAQQRQIAALHAVGLRVSRSLELDKVMQYAVEEVAQVFEVDASAISLIEPESGDLVIRAQHGLHTFAHTPVRIPHAKGVAWETLKKKELTIVESWEDETRLAIPEFREERVRATVLVPMLLDDEPVGVLSAMSHIPRTFTVEELNLLKTLADQVAIALKNARLHEETRRQSQEQTFLFGIAEAVAPLQNLAAIAEEALSQTLRFLAWPSGVFLVEDNESGALVPKAYHGEDTSLQMLIHHMRAIAYPSNSTHTPHIVQDRSDLTEWHNPSDTSLRTILQIPLQARNHIRGWLVVGTTEILEIPAYTQQVLVTVGNYLGVTLENVQLYHEMAIRESSSRALYQVTRAMTGHNREQILKQTLEELHNGIPYDIGGVLLTQYPPLELFHLWITISPTRLTEVKTHLHNELSILGESFPQLPDAARVIIRKQEEETLTEEQLLSYLEAPILQNDKPTGAILLARRRPFQANEQQMIFILAYQLSQVLESIQLYHQAQLQAQQLQQANARLSEQETEQMRIFDNIAHELYNPVTFIRGYTEVLLEEGLGSLNDTQQQALTVLLKQANLLSQLVHRLGTIKFIDPQSLEQQYIDLTELLRKAAAMATLPASRKSITIDVESAHALPQAWADSERMSEVIEILLRHVVQTTPREGKICVHVYTETDDTISVAITSRDSSPQQKLSPIHLKRSDKLIAHHSEMAHQSEMMRQQQWGSSMNLALCRRIIEAHGGSIGGAEDALQEHTFYFRLPTSPLHPTLQ
ncbi:MAG: GAF domain-containing protein [Anaerolineae bacterium]|nr:GAF domain-containing protein [Anaerolineae bacterium]